MEATTADTHHHHHHDEVEVNPATWSDPKRYAWLLGIVVPLAPFMAWGSVALTGFGGFWLLGPLLVFVVFPLLDIAVGVDATNPPDSVLKWLEQDRYYRWCTYVFIPIQYAGLILACWLWSSGDLSVLEQPRPRLHDRRRRRDRDQHRPRARPQARQLGALAEPGRPGADRLRPLLHRAQPRPPRPRRHPRGPGQLAAGRELLGLPAAHRRRQPALGLGDRGGAPRPPRQVALDPAQRHPRRLGDDRRPLRRAGDRLRPGRPALPADPGGDRLLAAGGRQLPRALRPAARRSARTAATSAACPSTAGTATTSPPTSCSTTCSATATTTPTRPAATRRCATSTRRRSCPPATRG